MFFRKNHFKTCCALIVWQILLDISQSTVSFGGFSGAQHHLEVGASDYDFHCKQSLLNMHRSLALWIFRNIIMEFNFRTCCEILNISVWMSTCSGNTSYFNWQKFFLQGVWDDFVWTDLNVSERHHKPKSKMSAGLKSAGTNVSGSEFLFSAGAPFWYFFDGARRTDLTWINATKCTYPKYFTANRFITPYCVSKIVVVVLYFVN